MALPVDAGEVLRLKVGVHVWNERTIDDPRPEPTIPPPRGYGMVHTRAPLTSCKDHNPHPKVGERTCGGPPPNTTLPQPNTTPQEERVEPDQMVLGQEVM